MTAIDLEELNNRIKSLGQYNGIKMVLVSLPGGPQPPHALLDVYFYNKQELQKIIDAYAADPDSGRQLFSITGGQRIIGGFLDEQVHVTHMEAKVNEKKLIVTVSPVGDYSTYTLVFNDLATYKIDPLLSEIKFKFRPGCFTADCAPAWTPGQPAVTQPLIDYMSKDYESFRHLLIKAMKERVVNWEPTSEADLDMVLLELFSVRADELSDQQDRVMNEAYLTQARKRVSLARHARLMDYHIHQGQQASTWIAVKLVAGQHLQIDLDEYDRPEQIISFWTGHETADQKSQTFISRSACFMHHWLNEIKLYSWNGVKPTLPCGSLSAELLISDPTQTNVEQVRDWINSGQLTRLLIQEKRNPETGQAGGVNPEHRQIVRLKPEAEAKLDPIENVWMVTIHWWPDDALSWNAVFYKQFGEATATDDITLFHGNLIEGFHGQLKTLTFKSPDEILASEQEKPYQHTKWGTCCYLDTQDRLSYRQTPPGNQWPSLSTMTIEVADSSEPTAVTQFWEEQITLVKSTDEDEHFIIETDEAGESLIRFGNGIHGKALPEEGVVTCSYQVGQGLSGNIGRDALSQSDEIKIDQVWNPFDVINGLDPEPTAKIIRRVQEAYLAKQFRAVTLEDYAQQAEALSSVSQAIARYQWSGSWRIIRVVIDPVGGHDQHETIRKEVAQALAPLKLIGDDLEVRLPRLVPLTISVALCVHPDYWIEDIRYILEQEFSTGYTPDGRPGFFHPDQWTFDQDLLASQVLGRIEQVVGVSHVTSLNMKRFHSTTPGTTDRLVTQIHEIIQVENDPDHQEHGTITFDIKGGRQ